MADNLPSTTARRSSIPIWIWILGAVVLIAILWMVFTPRPTPVVAPTTPVVTVTPVVPAPVTPPGGSAVPPTASATALVPVALIIAAPPEYFDKTVSGTARVADVPTDRGFYLEENGRRIFAILGKGFTEKQVNVNPGQTVRVSGVLRAPSRLDDAEVGTLQDKTRELIKKEPVYLVVQQVEVVAKS